MMEFELPILGPDTPIDQAFAPMIDFQKSGIVCRGVGEVKIVTFAALEKALNAGRTTLRDVDDAHQGLVITSDIYPTFSDPGQITVTLSGRSLKYGVLQGAYKARILSISEKFATTFLAPPRGFKCGNPNNPDYYPPNVVGPNPRLCVVCGALLP